MGDAVLAEFMRDRKVPAPVERIVHTDWLATAINREKLGKRRIVKLECGHDEITRNLDRCRCSTCHKMILDGEDYEAFRNRRF
jgi:hypothetical protein